MNTFQTARRSSVQVWYQLALERRDHVLDQEFAFLQAPDTQLIDHRVVLQPVNQVVEISVTDAQFTQSVEILERLSIDFVGHRFPCYSSLASSSSQSLSVGPTTTNQGFRISAFAL